jgi:hypothetical protein
MVLHGLYTISFYVHAACEVMLTSVRSGRMSQMVLMSEAGHFLNLPSGALRQMVETPLHGDMLAYGRSGRVNRHIFEVADNSCRVDAHVNHSR